MPIPTDLFAQIKSKSNESETLSSSNNEVGSTSIRKPNPMLAQLLASKQKQQQPETISINETVTDASTLESTKKNASTSTKIDFQNQPFVYDETIESFLFAVHHADAANSKNTNLNEPCLIPDMYNNDNTNIMIPLGPCIYRMTDYTYIKKEPILLHRCILKLGVLRCLQRECNTFNTLLWERYHTNQSPIPIEEDEIGKIRFMELLSNCGIYQKVSELLVKQIMIAIDQIKMQYDQNKNNNNNDNDNDDNDNDDIITEMNNMSTSSLMKLNPYRVPQIQVDGLNEFLKMIETLTPSLQIARNEIKITQSVSFYPGLGELFTPGSKLTCYPEGKNNVKRNTRKEILLFCFV